MRFRTILPLSLLAQSEAHLAARQIASPASCAALTTLPPVAVTAVSGPGSVVLYKQCYTVTYPALCPMGLTTSAYTVTETCSRTVCRSPSETAPPPGFTRASVACPSCGSSGGRRTELLTFPSRSLAAYSSSGYEVQYPSAPTPVSAHAATQPVLPTAAPAGPPTNSSSHASGSMSGGMGGTAPVSLPQATGGPARPSATLLSIAATPYAGKVAAGILAVASFMLLL